MDIEIKVIWAIMILYMIIVAIVFICETIELATFHTIIKQVKCYDKYSNEIIGQTCKEEIECGIIHKLFDNCATK